MRSIDTLYTIGYSGFKIKDLIQTLKDRQINAVIDVRSQPFCSWNPDYNKENLARHLKEAKIHYRNYIAEFGARQTDPKYLSPDGYVDFEKFTSLSPDFASGVQKLVTSMAQGYCFCLLCSEKEPSKCHRAIMVARVFFDAGYEVEHLLPQGDSVSQSMLEYRMVDHYFPDRQQSGLFDGEMGDDEYIDLAYQKRNAEIGWRPDEQKPSE